MRDLNITGNSQTLTLTSSGTLVLYGNWMNAGTFNPATNSQVSFQGTAAQSVTNTSASAKESFYNLEVNKSSGTLTLSSDADIQAGGTVNIQSGTLDVASSKKVILRSAAPATEGGVDVTARLGQVLGTLTPSSVFQVERYINIPSYRLAAKGGVTNAAKPTVLLSPSVKNLTVSSFANGGISLPYPGTDIAGYQEMSSGGVHKGWKFRMTSSSPLNVGSGYLIFAGQDNTDDLLSVTGPVHTGSLSVPVTYTALGTAGWNLLGNPYPCELDFEEFYSANASVITRNLYIMDPYNSSNNNSSYFVYQAGTGIYADPRDPDRTNGQYLASSQGFFVVATKNGNVVFNETMKPLSRPLSVYGNFRKEENELIKFLLIDSAGRAETVVNFNPEAENGFDPYFDALNISTKGSNIYTIADGQKLIINGIADKHSIDVPLVVESPVQGVKTIKVKELSFNSTQCFLLDNYLNKFVEINAGAEYSFQTTEDAASSSAERFRLVSELPVVTGYSLATDVGNHLKIKPNPVGNGYMTIALPNDAKAEVIEVVDLNGNVVFQESNLSWNSFVGINLPEKIPNGVYMLKVTSSQKVFTEKIILNK